MDKKVFCEEPHLTNFQVFKEIYLNEDEAKSKTFDFFTSYITQRDIIEKTKLFLESVSEFTNYKKCTNPRILLTSYIISYCPKEVLVLNEDMDIFEVSHNLLFSLQLFLDNNSKSTFQSFRLKLIKYYKLFDLWKNKDKKRTLHNLAKSYWDIESHIIFKMQNDEQALIRGSPPSDIDIESNEIWMSCAKDEQKDIINKVLLLGGQEALEYFNSLVPVMVNEDFVTNVDGVLKTAYWDLFKEELSKTPPNYLSIIPMLKETKKLIKSCVPNAQKIHEEVDESIDIELITQMIEHNAFDDQTILSFLGFIIGKIQQLDAEEFDEENKKWRKTMFAELMGESVKYQEFFPKFFKEAFCKLEVISHESKIIREEMKRLLDNDS